MEIIVKKENGLTITMPLSDDATAKQCVDAFVEVMFALSYTSESIESAANGMNL